ncbi:hypothetical protein NHP200010_15640 [Helicobacter bizzozeronii]|uniref:hypothetical protein n=1 Tax=Helicobacter bizzozeronii TaxID=56877 RepID=UPI00244D885C|nr:hypothetical protein [Helicobacter bizzozeronii]GMB93831.1 hypothetical protein NHP200010_15640 [Helicobacter bizzozeronii]
MARVKRQQKLFETPQSKEIRICMPQSSQIQEHQAPRTIVVRVLQGQNTPPEV